MSKLICWLFGYRFNNYGSQLRIAIPYYDGISRAHRTITGECMRCGKWHRVGSVIDRLHSADNGEGK